MRHFWPDLTRFVGFLFLCGALGRAETCANMRPFRNAALVIGISDPVLPEGPRSLRFAGADADLLAPLLERLFGTSFVFRLSNGEATTARVTACLDNLTRFSDPGGKVVIFISARGFSSSQMEDGYVLTSDAAIDKLSRLAGQIGNGISIQMLRRKVAAMQAKDKFLFLDLSRDPVESPGLENLINNRLLDKKFLDAASRQVVLGSGGTKRSLESTDLKRGYYAGGLFETLASKPGLDLQALFDDLKTWMKVKSRAQPSPDRPASTPNDGWRECPFCRLSSLYRGPLIAAEFPGLFVAQALTTPIGAGSGDEIEAVTEEERAQRVFVRYADGDHFPGDPLHECEQSNPELGDFRLCREEFELASKQFRHAADLHAADLRRNITAPDPDGKQALIDSLLERARFCQAQADLLSGKAGAIPEQLGRPAQFKFAESHNVLGIAFLELGKYVEAEEEFQQAIHKAPHWAYPRHNLALTYIEHGNYTAAEREYRAAIRLTPVGEKTATSKQNPCFHGRRMMIVERPYLYYNLGVLLQRLNRLPEAQEQYCLAEASFESRLRTTSAPQNESNGDEAARAVLDSLRAKAAQINLADVNNSLGTLFEARNKFDRAVSQFRAALNNNPRLTAARFNLAKLDATRALASGDPAAAAKRYTEVLDVSSCRGSSPDLACVAARTELQRLTAPNGK